MNLEHLVVPGIKEVEKHTYTTMKLAKEMLEPTERRAPRNKSWNNLSSTD
jgi:hypothetical protein